MMKEEREGHQQSSSKAFRPPARRIENLVPKCGIFIGTFVLFVVVATPVVFGSFNLFHWSGKGSDVQHYLYGEKNTEDEKIPVNLIITFVIGIILLVLMGAFTVSMWKRFAKSRARIYVSLFLLVAVFGTSILLSFLFPPNEYGEEYFLGILPIIVGVLWFLLIWTFFFVLEFFTGNYFRDFRFRRTIAVVDLILNAASFIAFILLMIATLLDGSLSEDSLRIVTGILVVAELLFLVPLSVFKTFQMFIYEGDHDINYILIGIFNAFTIAMALLNVTYAWKLVVPFAPVRNAFTIQNDTEKKHPAKEEQRTLFEQIRANIPLGHPGGGFTELRQREEGSGDSETNPAANHPSTTDEEDVDV